MHGACCFHCLYFQGLPLTSFLGRSTMAQCHGSIFLGYLGLKELAASRVSLVAIEVSRAKSSAPNFPYPLQII